ncbi:MAG TPA: endolytic transglycosylase MltG [Roseiarcus sp.]|nr:endolytic transglycosylase MltG [Roseiarcus sp.]
MSGELDSGVGEAPPPRVSLFGLASKPAPGAPPPPKQPPRKPRRSVLSGVSGFLTFVLLGALATAGALGWLLMESRSPGPLAADKVVLIVREDDGGSIADQLERAGVIDSAMWFNILTLLDGNRGALKRGEYEFKAGVSMTELEQELLSGKVVLHPITFPEGLTSDQFVQRLRENDVLLGEVRESAREGSLLPETYKFAHGETRQALLTLVAKAQAKTVEEIWAKRASDLPIKSPGELVTLASIVEKETGKPEERARVAGVFVNRLQKHMKLQSDPTIVYGLVLGKGTLGHPITKAELDQPTPYNTYLIDGLPPGPICNPGKAALEAAANPVRTKELYFVADGTGGHVFAETLDQHLKNVARWRQIEKDVKDRLAPDAGPTPAAPAIRGAIEPVDPAQFGALAAPAPGRPAPGAVLARLAKIGADRNAKDAALASLAAPSVRSIEEIGGAVVSGVNDGPPEGEAFADPSPPGTGTEPIASVPLSPAMLAEQRAREAKYGTPSAASNVAAAGVAPAQAPAQPGTASGRPRIYDASEGTPLDPLLNKTYDLSYAKVVPTLQ